MAKKYPPNARFVVVYDGDHYYITALPYEIPKAHRESGRYLRLTTACRKVEKSYRRPDMRNRAINGTLAQAG